MKMAPTRISLIFAWAVVCLIGLNYVSAMTFDATEDLVVLPHPDTEEPAAEKRRSKPIRTWKSREGVHYKRSKLGIKVFDGFEKFLNPVLDEILTSHPRSQELKKFRDSDKVEISHHMVPMRDGKRLSTIIINPLPANRTKGAMLSRSPYGPTSDQFADIFLVLNGFAAVIQDQRGTFLSEGDFSMWHDDANDGFDTLEWIAKQPWSNGKVHTVGVSADGCGSAAMILSQPSQLKGQLIMWASLDGHDTAFPGGVFREGLVTGWMTLMAPLTRGVSLEKTLPDILAHEELGDWWTPIQGPGHYHQAKWPTIHISAWADIFSGHHLKMYNGLDHSSRQHHLFVGPLGHCLLGSLDPFLAIQEERGIVNAIGLSSEVFGEIPAEDTHYLKKVKLINVYMQGSRTGGSRGEGKVGHYWSSFDSWPETKVHRLLLSSNSELVLESAESESRNLRSSKAHYKEGFAEFTYNPLNAAITHGGNNLILIFLGMGCGIKDQRRFERRDDVVVFSTAEALQEPLALLGQMKAVLYVSTDRPDTDFYVSVNDVHPDGSSMQIRYGIQRMRWRESTPFRSVLTQTEANTVYRVDVDLWFTGYVVAPGHRLRVTIGSSNTPYYAKNDNSGEDELGFKYILPAVNRVYWSKDYPSHVELPVVNLKDIPKNELF